MSTTVLKALLGWSIVSTALHYTHNAVAIEDYPRIDGIADSTVQALVPVSWIAFTAIGVVAYRRYAGGRRRGLTAALLAVYSLAGITSLGHFVVDEVDLPLFWMLSIASDGAAGFAVLAFAVWAELTGGRRIAAT